VPSGGGGGIGSGPGQKYYAGGAGMGREQMMAHNDPWGTYKYNTWQQRMLASGMNPAEIHLMSNPFAREDYMHAMGVPENFMGQSGSAYLPLMMQGRAPGGQHQPWGLNQYSNSGGNPWQGGY